MQETIVLYISLSINCFTVITTMRRNYFFICHHLIIQTYMFLLLLYILPKIINIDFYIYYVVLTHAFFFLNYYPALFFFLRFSWIRKSRISMQQLGSWGPWPPSFFLIEIIKCCLAQSWEPVIIFFSFG